MSNESTEQSKAEQKRKQFLSVRTGFESRGQPTSMQKKKGWERKKMAKKLMDFLATHADMTGEELDKYIQEETKAGRLTMGEMIMLNYLKLSLIDGKIMLDYINRHVPYAPTRVDVGSSETIKEIETIDSY